MPKLDNPIPSMEITRVRETFLAPSANNQTCSYDTVPKPLSLPINTKVEGNDGALLEYANFLNQFSSKTTVFFYKFVCIYTDHGLLKIHLNRSGTDLGHLFHLLVKKKQQLHGPFLWIGFNCLKVRATSRRQFTFYH